MAEREYLPGLPPPKLVRAVRKHLRSYGISPQAKQWRLAWTWAQAVKISYVFPAWPSPNEIGTQYMALLLADMREHWALKLPPRAGSHAPPAILAALGTGPAMLPAAKPAPRVLPAAEAPDLFTTLAEPTT